MLPPPVVKCKRPFSVFKPRANSFTKGKWQTEWITPVTNNLHSIKPILCDCSPTNRIFHRDETIFVSLQIGHTLYTNGYI